MTSPALQPIPLPTTVPSPAGSAPAPDLATATSPPVPPANSLMFSPKLTHNLFSSPPLKTQLLPDPPAAPTTNVPASELAPERPSAALQPETRPDGPHEAQGALAETAPASAPEASLEPTAEQVQPPGVQAEDGVEGLGGPAEPAPVERQAEEDEIIAEQFTNEYHDSKQQDG